MSVFAKIISGEIPAEKLYEDDLCIVINDLYPQAKVHMLVIPKKPIVNLLDANEDDQTLLGHLNLVAAKMAKERGLEGFRLVVNNGEAVGQTVFHLHLHVLGGQTFKEANL